MWHIKTPSFCLLSESGQPFNSLIISEEKDLITVLQLKLAIVINRLFVYEGSRVEFYLDESLYFCLFDLTRLNLLVNY